MPIVEVNHHDAIRQRKHFEALPFV
jgi:hypothetical protein